MSDEKQKTDNSSDNTGKLRLRTPKDEVVFVAAENVLMAKSLDHWVQVLVKDGKEYRWFDSHLTLCNFLLLPPAAHLVRGNRFYALNRVRVTKYFPEKPTLVFDNVFTVELEHPLPPYFI